MRRGYLTLTPAVVHRTAHAALSTTLGFGGCGRCVTPAQVLDLLLFVAATARTLFAVVTRHFPFSHETARQAVRTHLPPVEVLRDRLAVLFAVAAFTGTATAAQYQTVLRTVTFSTSVNVSVSVTLPFTFTGNDGGVTGSGTRDVVVTGI